MLGFFVLFALSVPFPALYVLAVLDTTQDKWEQLENLNPRVTATPRRLEQPPVWGQRSASQQLERMEFSESNIPPSVAEFQAVILAGYGNA